MTRYRTEVGIESLWKVLTKLSLVPTGESASPIPLFADFTWGAGGSTSDLTLDLCKKAKTEYNTNPNMHITCTNVDRNTIDDALKTCKEAGITNILALRGDPPVGQEVWTANEGGFTCARDLVKNIRATHGDFFHITVAGYPEGHPNKMSLVTDGYDSLSEAEKADAHLKLMKQVMKRFMSVRMLITNLRWSTCSQRLMQVPIVSLLKCFSIAKYLILL